MFSNDNTKQEEEKYLEELVDQYPRLKPLESITRD